MFPIYRFIYILSVTLICDHWTFSVLT